MFSDFAAGHHFVINGVNIQPEGLALLNTIFKDISLQIQGGSKVISSIPRLLPFLNTRKDYQLLHFKLRNSIRLFFCFFGRFLSFCPKFLAKSYYTLSIIHYMFHSYRTLNKYYAIPGSHSLCYFRNIYLQQIQASKDL